MKAVIIFICVGLYACSYRLVTPDQAGPVSALQLGDFADHTSDGSLGLWARGYVGQVLNARTHPRVLPSALYTLTGTVQVSSSSAIAYDAQTDRSLSRIDVTCTLKLMHAEQGLVWQGAPQLGYRMYARGVTPLETHLAQRQALAAAGEDAVRRALEAFLRQPRLIEVERS